MFVLAVPLSLAAVCVVFPFLSRSTQVSTAVVLITVAASIYAFDIYLNVTNVGPREREFQRLIAAWRTLHIPYDARSWGEVVGDLRREGADAFPKINPGTVLRWVDAHTQTSQIRVDNNEVVPLGSIANVKAVYCNELGEWLIYDSDEYGFHNPKGIWSRAALDVAVVGDSYAEGACVPRDKGFVALLRARHSNTINLGQGGNGPLLELASIREFLPLLKPRYVVWVYTEGNDLDDLKQEKTSEILRNYLRPGFSQNLVVIREKLDHAIRAHAEQQIAVAKSQSRPSFGVMDIMLLRQLRSRLFPSAWQATQFDASADPDLDLLRGIFAAADRQVRAWGGTLVVTYLPDKRRFFPNSGVSAGTLHRDRVVAMLHSLNIDVIDLLPVFAAQPDVKRLSGLPNGMGHLSEEGNALIADGISKYLSDTLAKRP